MFANFAYAFALTLALSLSVSAVPTSEGSKLTKRQARPCKKVSGTVYPGLVNPANCVVTVPTDQIDDPVDGLQVGTINNWGGGNIPPALRGIFYLEGNPYAAECLSMGAAYWNASTGTSDAATFQPKVWSSDVNAGQLPNNLNIGVIFQTNCKKNWLGRQECTTGEYHTRGNQVFHTTDYTANEVDNNHWIRASNIPNAPTWPGHNQTLFRYTYNMWRIVDENGKRTDKWDRYYIANIGKTLGANTWQLGVHLGAEQEVPQRR